MHLTVEERKAVAEASVRFAAGRLPVFVGVSHPSTLVSVELAQHAEKIGADGLQVDRVIVEGTPFVEIGKFVRQTRIDLIVLGSYGGRSESMEKIFFGATAEKVVRTAGCAVLTVPLPAKKTAA